MKRIRLHNLKNHHFPLETRPYETGEGNEGFALFTQNNQKVDLESGSYGYDTYFPSKEVAQATARFLNAPFFGLQSSK